VSCNSYSRRSQGSSGSGQQQFFRSKPFDADVAQGGTAVIECEVANRAGRVQWTKDGLTLGKQERIFAHRRLTCIDLYRGRPHATSSIAQLGWRIG
jgi:hypothetical protein